MPKLNFIYIQKRLFYNAFKNYKFISKCNGKYPKYFPIHSIYNINCLSTTVNLNKFSKDSIPDKFLKPDSKDTNIIKEIDADKNIDKNLDRSDFISDEMNIRVEDTSKMNVDEEMLRYDYEEFEEREEIITIEEKLPLHRIRRGLEDVYDLDDLMLLLSENKALNAFVIKIPEKYDYCDFMVIVTGTSYRHLRAMAEDIKKTYKNKRNNSDPESVDIEGLLSKNWLALDLGNIVVHLFLEKTRQIYDLEQLWSVGSEFDDQSLKAEIGIDSFEQAANFMKNFDNELQIFKALSKKE